MSIELKIKSKHLSEESKIIRFEENKLLKQAKWLREHQKDGSKQLSKYESLSQHRKGVVRNENRATFLARVFLDGRDYSSVEKKRKVEKEYTFQNSIVPRIVTMVNKYGNKMVDQKDIIEWSRL